MRQLVFAALLGSTALIPAAAAAQTEPKTPAVQGAATAAQGQLSAEQFVREAANSGMFEIQSSQLAEQKAHDPRIKQFGQQMVQDHTNADNQLKAIAQKDKNLQVPDSLDQEHQQKLQQLQEANGTQFDQLYARMQLDAHQKAVSLFQNFAQSGDDPQLKQFAQKTLPALEQHLQMAQTLPEATAANQRQPEMQGGTEGQGSRIVVQEPAPQVRVEQSAPQVTVQQPQPQVTVHQPRPEITVRMPPPTVTVQQPQPEIIVRMPEPQVHVSMPQPHVAVSQPKPQVQVIQPQQQPEAQVKSEAAQVQVQQTQPGQEAHVQIERAQQPEVKFEQTGQPNVKYTMTGQPKIQYEQSSDRAPARQEPTATGPSAKNTAAVEPRPAATGNKKALPVSKLEDMSLYDTKGDDLGHVEKVVQSQADGTTYVVIGHGGFLGLGEKRVAIPLDNVWVQNDRIVAHGLSNDQIKAMPDWNQQVRNYHELTKDQTAPVIVTD
jgi:predicted outer membrane protein/sporulation protein YlmC with PRC-barrel domain